MYHPGQLGCAVCRKPADVWCHQDAVPLCYACDQQGRSTSYLASRHVQAVVHGQEVERPAQAADIGCSGSIASWAQAKSGEVNGAELRNWSMQSVNPVPDIYNEYGSNHATMGTAPSFESLELFQAGIDDQPLLRGAMDYADKAPYQDCERPEMDACAVPTSPSCATHAPNLSGTPRHDAACFPPQQPLDDVLPAAQGDSGTGGAEAPARPGPPPPPVQHNPMELPSTATQPSFTAAVQAPVFCPSASQPGAAAMFMHVGAQPLSNYVPMPMMAAMPAMMPLGWQAPPWMAYIPASLRPRESNDAAAASRAVLRQRQLARFHEKKRLLSCRKTVRYASRKLYADSRPRVHGRFIRKSDTASAVARGGTSLPRAHATVAP